MSERKAVVYCRVSTEEQTASGAGLLAQRDRIRALAWSQGVELSDTDDSLYYTDAGWSGKDIERPALQRLLKDVDAGEVGMIFIYSLSRLARNTRDMLTIVERLTAKDVRLVSTSEMLDTKTAGGRLLLTILAAVATWEREVIVERTVEALAAKKRRGERIGTTPYGYTAKKDGKLIPEPREQEIIRRVAHLRFVERRPLSSVAGTLNMEGYRTRGGGLFEKSGLNKYVVPPARQLAGRVEKTIEEIELERLRGLARSYMEEAEDERRTEESAG